MSSNPSSHLPSPPAFDADRTCAWDTEPSAAYSRRDARQESISRNALLTACSHPWAMNRQKLTAILSWLFIATGAIGALYSLGHTRSVFSFICLCAVMATAVTATSWIDRQQPIG
jgi:hypothetical protein